MGLLGQPPAEGGDGEDDFFSDEEPEVVSFGDVSFTVFLR